MNVNEKNWRKAILHVDSTIQEAIKILNDSGLKIILAVNEIGQLEGTVSDGDIRRGLLKGLNLESPITDIVQQNPLVVSPEIDRKTVFQLMLINKVQQIPVVDEKQCLIGLHAWDKINTPSMLPNWMVIMAGGRGTRLRPYTEKCPKPLVKVAGKPMLEHIIERAKSVGISRFILAIHYLGRMIEEYFGHGERLGVRIEYVKEDSPLGTAGALTLIDFLPDLPFVVTNSDVLTDIHYGELIDFHIRHKAVATMAVRLHEWQHPFGVINISGIEITGIEEKPIAQTYINAGVYVLEPQVINLMNRNCPCDMTALFDKLREQKQRTVAYPMHEPWLDVGKPDDLDAINGKDV